MWGPVGRGKTWLMDLFFQEVTIQNKLRLHFHRFMQEEVHGPLKQLRHQQDPIPIIARNLAQRTQLLCFDELLVEDITDAMLLGTLFQSLFDNGVTLVATSNRPPDGLYEGGLQRARFLPAIAALKHHCHVVELSGPIDHRSETLRESGVFSTMDKQQGRNHLRHVFHRLSGTEPDMETLTINRRHVQCRGVKADVVWFEFDQICNTPRSASDFISIADEYRVVMVSDVPQLDDSMPAATRRFIALIDEFYEQHVIVILTAAVPVDSLYRGKRYAFEFERTRSRLQAMQSHGWLETDHMEKRPALTPL